MKLKLTFNSLDCIAVVKELQCIHRARVNQIYDIDNKTYLLKLNKPNSEKCLLLIESGVRVHLTKCDWPKNAAPSGFAMKLRKHLNNKRITGLRQLGTDRVIDMELGSGEVTFHLIVELYSRGNVILTDSNMTIVALLRPFMEGSSFNYTVHHKLTCTNKKNAKSAEEISEIIKNSKKNLSIKKTILPNVSLGSSLLENVLIKAGIDPESKQKDFSEQDLIRIENALIAADEILKSMINNQSKGYIIYETFSDELSGNEHIHMLEFTPILFIQHENRQFACFDSFNEAVDEYFSKFESQKIELKALEQEKEAMNKVNKIREDQSSRVQALSEKQEEKKFKAELIMLNAAVVDQAIRVIQLAIASQMPWRTIKEMVEQATRRNDPVASLISSIKFENNHIAMRLTDPYADVENTSPTEVDIDLSLTAHANAKKYYDDKKQAALKEVKTLQSQKKALKAAEKKAFETLKTIKNQVTISKSRKVYWFEKFYWFVSSENYLVIGGRDQKQNELVVKRHLRAGDLYVHADLHGASSVVIKNPSGKAVPPRTLDEAGVMAVCYSGCWNSGVLVSAWWVYNDQVSKVPPTGEYLTAGSFMVRGQKNYLLPQQMQLGFSFMFKLEESSVFRHINERKVKVADNNCIEFLCEPKKQGNEKEKASLEEGSEVYSENIDSTSFSMEKEEGSKGISENIDSTFFSMEKEEGGEVFESLDLTSFSMTKDEKSGVISQSTGSTSFSMEKEEVGEVISENIGSISFSMEKDKYPIIPQVIILSGDGNTTQKSGSDKNDLKAMITTENENFESNKPSDTESNTSNASVMISTKIDVIENFNNDLPFNYNPDIPLSAKISSEGDIKLVEVANIQKIEHKKGEKIKRGQKGRQKKMKEKYKDQDEEERQLRLSILQPAGTPKHKDKKSKNSAKEIARARNNKESTKVTKESGWSKEPKINSDTKAEFDEEEDRTEGGNELEMLESLTALPVEEDELLFALPMVGPYSAVLNNKLKAKMVPGQTKRGKAARAAVEWILRSKECLQRERDLIRAVSDQAVARNFPGKVKLVIQHQRRK